MARRADASYHSSTMEILPEAEARAKLAETIRRICESREPIAIADDDGTAVAVVPLDDYESLVETANLLRSPDSARRLLDRIRQIEREQGGEEELV